MVNCLQKLSQSYFKLKQSHLVLMAEGAALPTRKHRYVFTVTEDRILEMAIERSGATDLDLIARRLPGRSARQCRERWVT
jgi:hypothetical protein